MNKMKFYEVITTHFDEMSDHFGNFLLLENAIKKAKEVLKNKQEDLKLMRKFDKGISGLYEQDFKEEIIEEESKIKYHKSSQTEAILVIEREFILEDHEE